jgi:uncharacterized protein YgiM (DUF1202 family)
MHWFHTSNESVPAVRRRLVRAVGMATAVFVVLALAQWPGGAAEGASGLAAVTAVKLTVRASASARARSVAVLSKGDIVRVLSQKGAWKKVSTSGGKTGWCPAGSLANVVYSKVSKSAAAASVDWPSDYINISQNFTYQRCMQDMNEIASAYRGRARIETVGTTVMGNPIQAIVLGNPGASIKVLFQAAIHARESITALVALRQAECVLKAASVGAAYKGAKLANMLDNVEIWVIPMANPDGVRLLYEGLKAVPPSMPELAAAIKKMNGNSANFTRWKANARGVDLNRNFTTGWKKDPNYTKPGPYNYPGAGPLTEPETIALRDLAVAKNFAATMSYHSSGELIYWYNPKGGNALNLYIANSMKKLSGYTVLSSSSQSPGGGFRDWYVDAYMRPGFTLEVGSGYCPLPQSSFNTYWEDMRYVMLNFIWTAAPKSLTSLAQ